MNNTMKNLKDEIERTYYRVISYDDPMVKENLESVTGILLSKEALTSLIEQEKESAIRKDREAIYKDIKSNYDISADEFFEQYLAERNK